MIIPRFTVTIRPPDISPPKSWIDGAIARNDWPLVSRRLANHWPLVWAVDWTNVCWRLSASKQADK